MKVSIIVAVYNTEAFVEKCLKSILNQSYKNIEVIVIDDGSIDGSKKKCQTILNNDVRCKLITTENRGVSSARNRGIEEVTGDYIFFVDSDDYIHQDYCLELVKLIEQGTSTLGICSFAYIYNNKIKKDKMNNSDEIVDDNEFFARILNDPFQVYYGVLWNKIFSTYIINNYGIRFDSELTIMEDWDFVMTYLSHIKQVSITSRCLYYYNRCNSNSALSIGIELEDSYKNRMRGYRNLKRLLNEKACDESLINKVGTYLLHYKISQFYKVVCIEGKRRNFKKHFELIKSNELKLEIKSLPFIYYFSTSLKLHFEYFGQALVCAIRSLVNKLRRR